MAEPSQTPTPAASPTAACRYWAFVSYSHKDKAWGNWLHRALETYRTPKPLRGRPTTRGENVPDRLFPIFRDREELPTSADLGSVIAEALRQTARLWDVVIADKEAPPWLAELAEIAGGQRLSSQGVLEPSPQDPTQLRQQLQKLSGDDDLSGFGRWIVADPSTRTIGPLSTVTVPQFVAARLQENTADSIKEAYDADPGNPLVLAALAKLTFASDKEGDKDEALFYFQVALRYARLANAPDQIAQVQAMAKALFPDDSEFSGATPAPVPAAQP